MHASAPFELQRSGKVEEFEGLRSRIGQTFAVLDDHEVRYVIRVV